MIAHDRAAHRRDSSVMSSRVLNIFGMVINVVMGVFVLTAASMGVPFGDWTKFFIALFFAIQALYVLGVSWGGWKEEVNKERG